MREHFKMYNELCNRLKELNYKYEALQHNLYDPKAVSYGVIRTTNPKTMVDRLSEKDEIEQEIKRLQIEKRTLYEKHINEISQIEGERKRSILRSYYLDKLTIYDISIILCLTEKRIYVIKREAELEFREKILQDATK